MCQADTRNGVSFVRQLGDVRCVEGYGWGFDEQGVWVDHGCRAEFRVASEPIGNFERHTRLEAGTVIPVRVNESITTERADGRIFTGSIEEDVRGQNGRVAIPRGSGVELIVRAARDGDLILDLESVIVQGQRYGIDVDKERVESQAGHAGRRTGEYAGGGAVLGAIIGALGGGGKGAAIGAGAGAAAGAATEIATRGRRVRIPAESILTFRLEQPLMMGVSDRGIDRDRNHYHVR